MLFDKEIRFLIATTRPKEAKQFYKEKLGLMLLSESDSTLEFRANGILIKMSIVKELTPGAFTILEWKVKDIFEMIKSLNRKDIFCERYDHLLQDKNGIWTSQNGSRIAWFKDPDGNILSIVE